MTLRYKFSPPLLALGLTGLLTACAANTQKCTLGAAADLKVTAENRAYYTDIAINQGTAHLEIDTGAFANLLHKGVADKLQMSQQMLWNVGAAGIGGQRDLNLAVAHTVNVGGAQGTRVQFLTVTDDAFNNAHRDGLLGMQFMAPYDDDLDFTHGHLRLLDAKGNCSTPATALTGSVYAVDLESLDQVNSPVITITINGVKLHAMIDSGSVNSLMSRRTADRTGLLNESLLENSVNRIRGIGPRKVKAIMNRLQLPVEIGALQISNMPVIIIDGAVAPGIDMLLGFDFVTLVHVWISHSSHTVLLQYPPEATPTN